MSGAQIHTPAQARAYLTAGRAVLTVKSLKTGDHVTFKVRAAGKTGPVSHFVSVRAGGPGESKYAYLGTVSGAAMFKLGRPEKTPYRDSDRPALAFRFLLENLVRNQMPPNAEVWHEGACGRCGRALTHPESIASGIGPECAKKAGR